MNERREIEQRLTEIDLQQLEDNYVRKKRRNQEVDELLHNIHDPRVSERLRIYRLVEEKFLEVENQVRKEVKDEIHKRKQQRQVQPPRQELPNFKSLNKMLKPQRMVPSKPAPFKVDPSRFFNVVSPPTTKKTSQPQLQIKYNPTPIKAKMHDISQNSESSSSPHSHASATSKFQKFAEPGSVKNRQNVGLVNYFYQDPDYRHRKWHRLTAHLLQGIDISPHLARPVNHLVKTLLDSKEHRIFVSGNQDDDPESLSLNSTTKLPSLTTQPTRKDIEPSQAFVVYEQKSIRTISDSVSPLTEFRQEPLLVRSPVSHQSLPASEHAENQESNSSPDYSMNFEEDDHLPPQQFHQISPEVEYFGSSACSATDRLSTIPEDSKSQDVDDNESVVAEKCKKRDASPERKLSPPSATGDARCPEPDELDVMMYTKSAKAMMEMLDELSLSQKTTEEHPKKDQSSTSSGSENRQRLRQSAPRLQNRNFSSSSGSSIPLYSASTSFTSESLSLEGELSEGPLRA